MQNLKKIYHQEVTQKLIARFETDRETDRQRNRDDELIKALVKRWHCNRKIIYNEILKNT